MAKSAKRTKGDIGEDICCRFLETKGYTIVERNYLRPWGEIDIVAKKGSKLSFIEVKSVSREPSFGRGGHSGFRPEENMHEGKVRRLHRAIQTYLADHKVSESVEWQLDLVCVYMDFSTRKARVEILENIVL